MTKEALKKAKSEFIKIVNDYDGMISTGFDKIGENFFNNLNGKLKIIAQVGVGYDNISIKSLSLTVSSSEIPMS